MGILTLLDDIQAYIDNPSEGLPEEVFQFVSKITPLVNVDLLIRDNRGRVLLSWRQEADGWHVPGGIVRFQETLENRIIQVGKLEIGIDNIEFRKQFLEVNQLIQKQVDVRGHFISFLYECFLPNNFVIDNKQLSNKDNGYLQWHEVYPSNMIQVHEMYKKYFIGEDIMKGSDDDDLLGSDFL